MLVLGLNETDQGYLLDHLGLLDVLLFLELVSLQDGRGTAHGHFGIHTLGILRHPHVVITFGEVVRLGYGDPGLAGDG